MFRDREKALQELQKQLLDEDEEDLTEEEYDAEEAEEYDAQCDEDDLPEEVYAEHSENVRAYNSDATDEDLDEYSQEVYEEPRRKTGCALWFAFITAGLLLALSYFLAKQGGLL